VTLGEDAQMGVQVLVWPLGFLANVFVAPETVPAWLGFLAQWNPVSATAAAARELSGNPTGITNGLLAGHAVPLAVGWPLVLTAIFLPLSANAYRNLSRGPACPAASSRTLAPIPWWQIAGAVMEEPATWAAPT